MVFRVEDDAPEVIVTLRLQGPVDRSFKRTVRTNVDVRWTLPAKLKNGQYRVFLSAVDLAGNPTAKVVSKTMTVNPGTSVAGDSAGESSNGESSVYGISQSGGAESVTAEDPGGSYTVYVTDTGEKYHAGGCQYLSESKYPMSLSAAQAAGYEPCSVCNP